MTIKQRPFTKFQKSSKGVASRYNKTIVSVIFKSINQLLNNKEKLSLTVETIYPFVENQLKENHIAVLKNDLIDIIIEILNFFIEEGDVDIYDSFFDDIDAELKKALWPSVSRLNDPEILNLLIDEIFNELDSTIEYTAQDLADRLSLNEVFNQLSYIELVDISEKALMKLENMNFLVE
ncbi:MAG TPA: hypothetical protein PLY36_08270 [Spirochaetota bacterium]|nr:hypothetical protein [Spirochaetota bacterium]